MASVSTYLNFERSTEEAFTFYKSVFGTEFAGPIMRHGDVPSQDGMPGLSDEDKRLVMNIALPILAGHLLMGTDIPASMGMALNKGNDVTIGLHPDSRDEADRLFAALSAGGTVGQPMHDAFWGDYYGDFTDKFGTRWMINYSTQS
ncbi:MAG TPA: VOC family protein [Thermomicrobiales bacterium]|nr:VOC family protein [Thermomicrobiales bacterium]